MRVRTEHAVEKVEQLVLLRLLSGEFADGTLPSRGKLAAQYGVCRNTVTAAVGRLIARGLCQARPGAGTVPVDLVRAVDHRLLLEVIKHASEAAKGLRLLMQLLDVVHGLLVRAAADAAASRTDVHLAAMDEVLEFDKLARASGEPAATGVTEYRVWRVVAAGSRNSANTATVNGLRALWLDAAVLKGAVVVADVAALYSLASAIRSADPVVAAGAADAILSRREKAVAEAQAGPLPPCTSPRSVRAPPAEGRTTDLGAQVVALSTEDEAASG